MNCLFGGGVIKMEKKRQIQKRRRRGKIKPPHQVRQEQILIRLGIGLAALLVLIGLITLIVRLLGRPKKKAPVAEQPVTEELVEETEALIDGKPIPQKVAFNPHAVTRTEPDVMMNYTNISVNEQVLENNADYKAWYDFDFGGDGTYSDVDGIITFRGNNFRCRPQWGTADMTQNKLETLYSLQTGSLGYGDAVWTGSGWTGQPLMERWPKSMRAHMNMYDWAKQKDDLMEVIYACMDGYIYFFELETGEKTRDPMYVGWTFKGAGALDPRGYPILYVGSGYNSDSGISRVFIINLLDCSVMYTFGNADPFSLRGQLSFFDSSALVDAQSDTLIYPGENGILYLIHLNTKYDEAAGTVSIDPDQTVRWRYWGFRSSAENFWVGMEDSAAIYEHYMFIADNGGHMMCLDLNTLQLVWVQDILDDSNSTPVLSVENDHLYLYVSTSFRLGWRSSSTATVPVFKIDAETGEIIWQTDYTCSTDDGVSGGVQSTIALGENSLEDYIYVTVAKTGSDPYNGVLACLDKRTGARYWEHETYYAWSSPVCVYTPTGEGRVIYFNCAGNMYLMDGVTGKELDKLSISEGAIEASPAVYNDYVVIGTRDCHIWGIRIK